MGLGVNGVNGCQTSLHRAPWWQRQGGGKCPSEDGGINSAWVKSLAGMGKWAIVGSVGTRSSRSGLRQASPAAARSSASISLAHSSGCRRCNFSAGQS